MADRLIARIAALHSYEVPCVAVWPIDSAGRLCRSGSRTARLTDVGPPSAAHYSKTEQFNGPTIQIRVRVRIGSPAGCYWHAGAGDGQSTLFSGRRTMSEAYYAAARSREPAQRPRPTALRRRPAELSARYDALRPSRVSTCRGVDHRRCRPHRLAEGPRANRVRTANPETSPENLPGSNSPIENPLVRGEKGGPGRWRACAVQERAAFGHRTHVRIESGSGHNGHDFSRAATAVRQAAARLAGPAYPPSLAQRTSAR